MNMPLSTESGEQRVVEAHGPRETETFPSVTMFSTTDGMHTGRSGYPLLAEYVPGARLVQTSRREDPRWRYRLATKLISPFTISRWYRLGSGVMEAQSLRAILQGFDGAIHVLWGDRDLGYLDAICRAFHRRLVGTFHSCPDTLPSALRYPRRLRSLESTVLVSECQYKFFIDAGVSPASIHVVLHGVDTKHFQPSPNQEETFTVLFVGCYRRDFERLGQICGRLDQYPDISIRVAAPRGTHYRIPALSNVTLLPRLSDLELRAEYQRAHCLLMPVESATANNAVLEALACGLPVVADAVDGIPEYAGKDSGILVTSRSVDEFVKAILAIKSSPSARKEMSLAARERAEQLDWSIVGRTMTQIYGIV